MATVEPSHSLNTPVEPEGPGWRVAIPAVFTLGSVTCAAIAAFSLVTMGWDPARGTVAHPDHIDLAAWLILLATVFDIADGFMARLFRAASPFGAQLDSLADAMSFGAAPALLVAAAGHGALWCTASALLIFWTAIIRVARYNAEKAPSVGPALYFKGLVTPWAGGALATWILFAHFLGGPAAILSGVSPVVRAHLADGLITWLPAYAVFVSAMMVSSRRYADLAKHYIKGVKPWYHVAGAALLAALIRPEPVLAVLFFGYALSGLFGERFEASRDAAP